MPQGMGVQIPPPHSTHPVGDLKGAATSFDHRRRDEQERRPSSEAAGGRPRPKVGAPNPPSALKTVESGKLKV